MPKCELCNPEKRTTWHYPTGGEDALCLVFECARCRVPMVVSVEHVHPDEAPPDLVEHMGHVLAVVCDKVFGPGRYYIDTNQRKIFDHIHFHGRTR